MTEDLLRQGAFFLGGASLVALISKWAITRSLAQFEEMLRSLHAIEKRLAGIDVQLGVHQKLSELVQEHDRAIAALQSLLEGSSRGKHKAS
jgi:hypothetical protein